MTVPTPIVDARKADDIKRELFARLREYLPELPEGKNDAGAALAAVVAELFEGTAARLNQAPVKNYLEFLNTIGAEAPPPAAARVPVTFVLRKDAPGSVPVPAGTKVSAKAENGETVVFETLRDFSATTAELEKVYYAELMEDRLFDAARVIGGKAPFRPGAEGAEDLQAHRLYIGHDYLLNLSQGASAAITVRLGGCERSPEAGRLVCSHWDGEDWRVFDNVRVTTDAGVSALTLVKDEARLFAKTAVNGVESFWIRIEPKGKLTADGPLSGFSFTEAGLSVGGASVRPESMFFNNVPLVDKAVQGEYFLPFGGCPRTGDAFYIASADALTKKRSTVTATYAVDGDGLRNARKSAVLSYEYWNGDGWFALPGAELAKTRKAGKETLTFDCPEDCLPLKLNGKEDYWIRIKISSGDYGREEYTPTAESAGQPSLRGVAAPKIGNLTLEIPAAGQAAEGSLKIITQNNNSYEIFPQSVFPGGLYPFQRSGGENDALYLGFSGGLARGALALFFDSEGGSEDVLPPPAVWEYYSAETEGWRRLAADDETSGFTEPGPAELWIPGDAGQVSRFGERLTWLRRVFPGGFAAEAGDVRLKGIYVNTVWASQRETVRNEPMTLISENNGAGGPRDYYGAVYGFAKNPVLSCEIYVNEARALSGREREALLEEGKFSVIQAKNGDGAEEFWVQWARVPSLLSSGAKDRHYEADLASGRVLFGNGTRGRVPPGGPNAVRADYLAGGGSKGNVAAFAVTKLVGAVPFAAGAVNPFPGAGGCDAWGKDGVMRRGPSLIRHRNRGITAEDLAALAAGYGGVAKVSCLPLYRRYESGCSGCVTLAVMPDSPVDTPELPPGLRRGLGEYLRERAAAALAQSGNIYIVSPVYVTASVTASVTAADTRGNTGLAARAESVLSELFHPVTGGPDGGGWRFGETPRMHDVRRVLESVGGVDCLEEVTLTLSDGENTFSAAAETVFPSAFRNPYNIIRGGRHLVEIKMMG